MSEDTKVGDYIRTKRGEIAKITEDLSGEMLGYTAWFTDKIGTVLRHEIVKSSKNIIDLIEIGDLVNGMIVFDIINCVDESRILKIGSGEKYTAISDNMIVTVVTHEQIEANEYKARG